MFGALLLAAVFLASGAVWVKEAKTPPVEAADGTVKKKGLGAMPARRKLGFGIFMIALGLLFAIYWLVTRG